MLTHADKKDRLWQGDSRRGWRWQRRALRGPGRTGQGADVVVLERAERALRGGNSAFASNPRHGIYVFLVVLAIGVLVAASTAEQRQNALSLELRDLMLITLVAGVVAIRSVLACLSSAGGILGQIANGDWDEARTPGAGARPRRHVAGRPSRCLQPAGSLWTFRMPTSVV